MSNSRRKTDYGAQYDVVPIDDVHELAMRRAADKRSAITPSRTFMRQVTRWVLIIVFVITLHIFIFHCAITRSETAQVNVSKKPIQ